MARCRWPMSYHRDVAFAGDIAGTRTPVPELEPPQLPDRRRRTDYLFNDAAVDLWGHQLQAAQEGGSWKLFWPDGTPLQRRVPDGRALGKTGRAWKLLPNVRTARACRLSPTQHRYMMKPAG